VLRQVKGNRMAAARVLGISRRALYRRLERHRITEVPSRVGSL
jgi:transcriptional regulator of acetoin/glycerol metabolism